MARYTRDVTLNKPADFVQFMVNDYLQKQAFSLIDYKGEQVFRAGDAMIQGYRYLKWSYNNGIFHLEAWFKGTFGGENGLTGFVGAIPKSVYKDSLEQLITLLQQDIPAQNMTTNADGTPAASPATTADGAPVMNADGTATASTPNAIPVQTVDNSKAAVFALVSGIVSLVMACCIPLVGVIFGCVAIANSKNALYSSKAGMAKAGKICGIIGVSLSAVMWIANIVLTVINTMG